MGTNLKQTYFDLILDCHNLHRNIRNGIAFSGKIKMMGLIANSEKLPIPNDSLFAQNTLIERIAVAIWIGKSLH